MAVDNRTNVFWVVMLHDRVVLHKCQWIGENCCVHKTQFFILKMVAVGLYETLYVPNNL
jgi:hypothetical protein